MQVTFANDDFITKVAQTYIGQQVAIVYKDVVFSAPTINPGITGRAIQITGNFTQAQAQALAKSIYGS